VPPDHSKAVIVVTAPLLLVPPPLAGRM